MRSSSCSKTKQTKQTTVFQYKALRRCQNSHRCSLPAAFHIRSIFVKVTTSTHLVVPSVSSSAVRRQLPSRSKGRPSHLLRTSTPGNHGVGLVRLDEGAQHVPPLAAPGAHEGQKAAIYTDGHGCVAQAWMDVYVDDTIYGFNMYIRYLMDNGNPGAGCRLQNIINANSRLCPVFNTAEPLCGANKLNIARIRPEPVRCGRASRCRVPQHVEVEPPEPCLRL